MTFASLVLMGVGTVLVWAAYTGENPVAAARDVLTGTDSGATPLVPDGDARQDAIDEAAPLRDARNRDGAYAPRSAVPRGSLTA